MRLKPRLLTWSVAAPSLLVVHGAQAQVAPAVPAVVQMADAQNVRPTTPGASAAGPTEPTQRLVYLNSELVGLYTVCMPGEGNEVYLSAEFFEKVRLRRSGASLGCQGQTFFKPSVPFLRIDARQTVSASVQPSDYETDADTPDPDGAPGTAGMDASATAGTAGPGTMVGASVLQHEVGLWRNPDGTINSTLGLAGRQYSGQGLFSLEGYVSSSAGRTQGYLSDASWKKNFPELGVYGRLGVNTFASTGSTTTLYGLVVGTDDVASAANTAQSIDGFADVPGRIQIRSRGTLVKEIAVPAGFFRIPASGLPYSPGAPGQYTLSLVDDSGRVVRTWDVFLPVGAQMLRPGTSNWKVFGGQIETDQVRRTLMSGPRNVGAGFVYRRGITPTVSAETSGIVGERTHGAGLEADYVPLPWLTVNGGATRYWGDVLGSSAFTGVDLHAAHLGVYTGYTRQSCNTQYFGTEVSRGQCQNLLTNAYASFEGLGRLSLLRRATLGGSPRASSVGFNWTPPAWKRVSLSLYGTRQEYDGSPSYSFGLMANISLDRGTLSNTASFAGRSSSTYSTSYLVADARNNQYSLGADVSRSTSNTTGDLRASAQTSPWFGTYQANAMVNNRGQVSLGLNESGALLMAQGEPMFTRQSDTGFAVVHLKDLGGMTLEDGSGVVRAVTNRDGYAAVPASRGDAPQLKVSADEMPDGVDIRGALLGRVTDDWTATLWKPEVRYVNHGWIRLRFPAGNALPMGSMLILENEEPAYVLGNGEVFVPNLPAQPLEAQVRMPGDTGRCAVRFPGELKLGQSYAPQMPEFVCTPPAQ